MIIANDDQINVLSNGLAQYSDFGQIKVIHWSDSPVSSAVTGYDAVVVTSRYRPLPNSSSWGNIIADFARNGGGVTCGFAFYDTDPWRADYGELELPQNNPFGRGLRVDNTGTVGSVLIPGHPLVEGVNELTTDYRYDISPNSNAVLVASFTDEVPLAGYSDVGAGRIVGIQAWYLLNPILLNSGDYMRLYRNAVVTSAARAAPIIASVTLKGADVCINWQGRADIVTWFRPQQTSPPAIRLLISALPLHCPG